MAVRLIPRASANGVDGVVEGRLKVRVTAAAVDGAANIALVHLLADELGVARRDVRIVAGAAARQKLLAIDGIESSAVTARWPGLKL